MPSSFCRELPEIRHAVLTKSAPSVAYNEFTYQSERLMYGLQGAFVCIRKYT